MGNDSRCLSSLESKDCIYRDENELIDMDCLFLDYLYCLYELLGWLMSADSILDGIEAIGLAPTVTYRQVLFNLSLFLIIFPTLFFVVSTFLPSLTF
jgi:hypothetical protein